MKVTRSWNSGWSVRNWSKAVKPRSTFLERSARSTRMIRCSRRRASSSPLVVGDLVGLGDPAQPVGVDPERVGADPDLAAVVDGRSRRGSRPRSRAARGSSRGSCGRRRSVWKPMMSLASRPSKISLAPGRAAGSARRRGAARGCGRSGGGRRRDAPPGPAPAPCTGGSRGTSPAAVLVALDLVDHARRRCRR